MGKLDELKQIVAGLFQEASDKNTIDKLASLNNLVGEVEQEQTQLTNRNEELLKSYKDVILHTTVGKPEAGTTSNMDDDIEPGATLDMDSLFSAESIQKFLDAEKK